MKYLLPILFLSLSLEVICQPYELVSGPELTNQDPFSFWTSILGFDESGYYFLREIGPPTDPDIILEKYSKEFQFILAKDIESSSGILGNSKNHFTTLLGNKEIIICLASWNKEKQESGFWIKKLSTEGELIFEEKQLITDKGSSLFKSNEYKASISADGTKLAVLTEPTYDKNAYESFEVHVFDLANLEKLAHYKYEFPIEMERYPQNRLWVNNQGVAYAFKTVRISGKEFRYFITSTFSGVQFQEELNFKDDQLNQSKFMVDKQGNLIGFGLLAEAKKYSTLWQRTWAFKLNKNEIKRSLIEPIDDQLLSYFMSEKKAAKEGSALNNFYIKDFLEKPLGGYVLLTEELDQRKIASPTPEGQPAQYIHKFRYGGVIAISYNENCQREWNTFFDKKQQLETPFPEMQLGSFAYTIDTENLHLIWNQTELYILGNYTNRFWKDNNGAKIRVKDVFSENARFPTFLSSINLSNGKQLYSERTFHSIPLKEIQATNNFEMAIDPSFSFNTIEGLVLLSRMDDILPKKFKFSQFTPKTNE